MDNHARRELYCLVENEDKAFKVIAVVDNDVADLKILVQQAKKNGTLRDADATDLVLFKLHQSVLVDPANTIYERLPPQNDKLSQHADELNNDTQRLSVAFSDKPPQGHLSIIVRVQAAAAPDVRKRRPEWHSGDEEQRKRLKMLAGVSDVSESDQRVLPDLYDSIQKLSEDPADYADPSRAVSLPFPSTNEVPPRFNLSGDGLFSYIGREMFTIVWETWLKIKADTRHRQAIYVYGTNGYGKSHILAALACLLIRKKEKVVYLPDCRAMLQEPLEYLRNALLFAFANSSFSDHRDWICECEDIESLAQFCRRYKGRLCFIIDQLNALDPEPKGEDDIPDHRKFRLNELLRRISAGHVLITSASANHKSAKHMASQDTGDQKIPLLGGMTMAEMSSWWSLFASDFAAFSQTEKQRIEDLTGCIPLLLTPFLGKRDKNLESLEPRIWDEDVLASVVTTAFNFGVGKSRDPLFKSIYVPLVQACLTRSYTSGYVTMLDHRYFYVENGCGRYTCGLARQGIVAFLRMYAEEGVFLGSEWYMALMAFKNNPSVIGFTVQQMVISRIASRGLRWGDNNSIPPTKMTTFHGNIVAFSKDMPSTYYVPLKFNLKAVDAIYVKLMNAKILRRLWRSGIETRQPIFLHDGNNGPAR